MNGPDSISDPVARRLRYTESSPSAKKRLDSRLMTWQVGPYFCWRVRWLDANVSADWTLTWHANCAWWRHAYVVMMSSLSGSGTWVGSSGIRVGSAHPGEVDTCDTWRASVRVASHPAGRWRRVRTFLKFDFDAFFTSGFVSSSSTQWYGQNTILTTFIFEQNQTPLKPYALIPIVGDSGSPMRGPVVYW